MEFDSMGIIDILSMSYITKLRGKNPQSARKKPNYHTKCGENCHKMLSAWEIGKKIEKCSQKALRSSWETIFFWLKKVLRKRYDPSGKQ